MFLLCQEATHDPVLLTTSPGSPAGPGLCLTHLLHLPPNQSYTDTALLAPPIHTRQNPAPGPLYWLFSPSSQVASFLPSLLTPLLWFSIVCITFCHITVSQYLGAVASRTSTPKNINFFFLFPFCSMKDWTQGLALARQACYHLSHALCPTELNFFVLLLLFLSFIFFGQH